MRLPTRGHKGTKEADTSSTQSTKCSVQVWYKETKIAIALFLNQFFLNFKPHNKILGECRVFLLSTLEFCWPDVLRDCLHDLWQRDLNFFNPVLSIHKHGFCIVTNWYNRHSVGN